MTVINQGFSCYSQQKTEETQYKSHFIKLPENAQEVFLSLGYRRCCDFDEGDKPGQDFAILRSDEEHVVGVVADGVSQSFYGNIAAKKVGQRLLDFLWQNRCAPPSKNHTQQILSELEKRTKLDIDKFSLPEDIEGVIRDVLEEKREIGSQTVFAAFLLDVKNRFVWLYQVGDVIALVEKQNGEKEVIESVPDGRWSSGGKSDLKLKLTNANNIKSIIIKSDGATDWGETLDREEISKFQSIAKHLAVKDDVSYIAVIYSGVATTSVSEPAQKDTVKPDKQKENATKVKKPEPSIIDIPKEIPPKNNPSHETWANTHKKEDAENITQNNRNININVKTIEENLGNKTNTGTLLLKPKLLMYLVLLVITHIIIFRTGLYIGKQTPVNKNSSETPISRPTPDTKQPNKCDKIKLESTELLKAQISKFPPISKLKSNDKLLLAIDLHNIKKRQNETRITIEVKPNSSSDIYSVSRDIKENTNFVVVRLLDKNYLEFINNNIPNVSSIINKVEEPANNEGDSDLSNRSRQAPAHNIELSIGLENNGSPICKESISLTQRYKNNDGIKATGYYKINISLSN